MPYLESDAEVQDRVAAFRQELQGRGWRVGENLQFEERWATDDMRRVRSAVTELVAAKPDAILATGARVMPVLKQQTQSIPVVFAATSDPVGRGLVASLARPGGNMTGFALRDTVFVDKLLELLKEIAPGVRRVAIIFNPDNPSSLQNVQAFQEAAARLEIASVIAPLRQPIDPERIIAEQAREPNTALLFPSDLTILGQRDRIVSAAHANRIPAIYADRAMVVGGGLISYGPDRKDLFRRSAEYVDRILRGESPADLPVQQPTSFELALNLKAAQMLGLDVPPNLLARADDVIE
jgi:putative tryptophan/tyrosine transport system substrate-binding protein